MRRLGIAVGICAILILAVNLWRPRGVRIETLHAREETSQWSYEANIPQIRGLRDTSSRRAVNERLRVIAERQKRMFLRDVSDLAEVQTGSVIKSSLTISYREGRIDDEVISVTFIVSPYLYDAAHPNHFTIPYNYDVRARRELKLEDLFAPGFEQKLSGIVSESLIDQAQSAGTNSAEKETFVREGAGPDADNFRSFTLEKNALTFRFDPYQAGSYAEGILQASFSGGMLESILTVRGKAVLGDAAR